MLGSAPVLHRPFAPAQCFSQARHPHSLFDAHLGVYSPPLSILEASPMQFLQHLIEFIIAHYLLTTAFLVVLALLLFTEGRKSGTAVSTQQATAMINRENAIVVDLRPKKEFAAGHIVDSINIPYDSLTTRISELDKHKGKPLLLVCAAGQHSGGCAKQLKAAGHDNVARLSGGVGSWRSDNLPLVK